MTSLPAQAGVLTTSLDWDLLPLSTLERTEGPPIAPLLDEHLLMQLYTLGLDLAVTDRISIGGMFPVVVNQDELTLPDGTTLDGTATGVGDITLMGKLRITPTKDWSNRPTVFAVAGVKTPTGADDLRNDEIGRFSPVVQPGTGAWSGVGGVSLFWPLSPVWSETPFHLYGRFMGQYSSVNSYDYQFGPTLSYAVGGGVTMWQKLTATFGLNGFSAWPDGLEGDQLDNTGSDQLAVAIAADWHWTTDLSTYLGTRIPFWRSLTGTQLVSPFVLLLGVRVQFGLWESGEDT